MKISAYDLGENCTVADRFTIIFEGEEAYETRKPGFFYALACDCHPFRPNGYGQHCEAMKGKHLGKRVDLTELPSDVRRFIAQEIYTQ